MKKSLFLLPALAAMTLASCSNEEPVINNGGDGNVIFTATLPADMASRAFSDGTKATKLTYAVYEAGTTNAIIKSGDQGAPEVSFNNLKATLSLSLVKGKTYDVVFWADVPGNSSYTFDAATQSITTDYTGITSGDENRDAFFQVEKGLYIAGAVTKQIELRRPFAQLNVGTDDLAVAAAAGTTVSATSMKVSQVYTTLNLLSGEVSNPTEITYAMSALPEGETFPAVSNSKPYTYLSMNYLLVAADKALVDCEFTINDDNGAKVNTLNFANVPVQRNYRTNIYGSLLTSPADFNIEIEKDYYTPDYEVEYVEARTAEEFAAAIAAGSDVAVPAGANIDLTELITSDPATNLTIATPTRLKVDGELYANKQGRINVTSELTVEGGGVITTGEDAYGIFNMLEGSTLNASDVTFEHNNEIDGCPIALREGATINLENVTFNSKFGTVTSWGTTDGGKLNAKNCTFNSTSNSARNGTNWTYCVLIQGNCEAVLENCTVNGVQGGVSASRNARITINSGSYATHRLDDEPNANAFYAVYVAQGGTVTINGGTFISDNNQKASIYNGNNDIAGASLGALIVKGGKFGNKGYSEGTKGDITPAEGFMWKELTDGGDFHFEIVPAE